MSTVAQVPDDVLERVARGERVLVRRGRKAVAAIVSLADLKAIEIRTVRPTKAEVEAIRAARREKGPAIRAEDLFRELGV